MELSKLLGRTSQTVSNYETGRLEIPVLVEGYLRLLDERKKGK